MGIITRHVVWELLKVFLLTLAFFTLLMMLIFVGQEAVRMNLGVGPTVRLMQFVLPLALAFAVPASILFSVCFVYGRMSADNEVTATKSLGVSPLVLLWPGLALAFVLSIVAVWLNDVGYSWGQVGMQRVVIQSVEEIAYRLLRSQRTYSNDRFSIIVRDVQGRTLIRPIMNFQENQDVPACTLTAAEAEFRSNLERGTLSLILRDYEIDFGDGVIARDRGTIVQEIPLAYASAKEQRSGSPQQLPISTIAAEIDHQREEITRIEQTLAAEAGMELLSGNLDHLSEGTWQAKRRQMSDARNRLNRLRVEPWRRWASGFSCLCFVLVGAPLAIRLRNADYITTFALCFVPILLFYYPLLAYGLDQAKEGALPPYTVWLANLSCIGVGVYLIRYVNRY